MEEVRICKGDIYLTDSEVQVSSVSQTTLSKHSHDFYELVFVREGFCLHHLEKSVFLTMEGDIFFIKPGMRHQYTGPRDCKIYNCLFNLGALKDSVLSELLGLSGISQMLLEEGEFPHLHLSMIERKTVQSILAQMEKESLDRLPGWNIKNEALLCNLLVECSRIYTSHEGRQSTIDCYSGYVTQAMQYIAKNIADNSLSVQELSIHVGVSGDYLSKQFKKIMGINVQEYIRRYRLSRAILCLHQGCSVGEASRLSGFSSVSYFSKEFKKEMGTSPSQYYKEIM